MAVDAGGPTGGVRRGLGGRVAHRMWRRRRAQEQARLRQVPPLPDSTTDPIKPSEKGHPNENYHNENLNDARNAHCSHDNVAKIGEVHTKQQENVRLTYRELSMSDDSSIENDDISEENSDSEDESEDESEEFSSSNDSDTDDQKEIKTGQQSNVSTVEIPVNVSNRENNDEFAEEIQDTTIESSQKTSNEQAQGRFNEQSQKISNERSQKTFVERSQDVTSSEQSQETSNEQRQQTSNEQSQGTSNEQRQETSTEQSQGTTNEQTQGASNKQSQETLNEPTKESLNEKSNKTSNEQVRGTPVVQSQIAEPERNPNNFLPFAEILRLHQLALIQKQFKTQVPEVPEVKTTKIIEHKSDDFPEWSDFLAMHEAKQKREYEEDHPEAVLAMSPISSEENKWICEEWAKMWAKCGENQQHIVEIEENSAEETSQKSDDYEREYANYPGREERNTENSTQNLEVKQLDSEDEEYEAESIVEYDDFQVMAMSTVDEKNIVIQDNEINMRRYEAMQDEIERKWLSAQKVKEVEERFKAERAERERSRNGTACGRRQNTRYVTDRMRRERARRQSDHLNRECEKIHHESEPSRCERSRLETQCAGIVMRNQGDRTRRGRVSCEIERVKHEWSFYEAECISLEELRHKSERDQRELEHLEAECLMRERVTQEVRLIKHLRQQTENIKQELAQHDTEQIERNWARQEADHLKRENFRSQAEHDGRERVQLKTQIHERKGERCVTKCIERNRERRGAKCVEAEWEPNDPKSVEYDQVERRLHWFQTLALIPIYRQNCQEAQRHQLADLVPRSGAQKIQQISLAGALSDHVLELGARRENTVDTFSQLAILGGINQQDVLQMSLWEEFFGVRLYQDLLLASETRCEQISGFRAQRELSTTPGEQREQVLSVFVRRIHRLSTPAQLAHTSKSIARLQRILHMKEVLFHNCINNMEIYFPVINIWEENNFNGFNLAGPLQDLDQYSIYDIVQRPQVPVQLDLHVRIQYPISKPSMVCLNLPEPDQTSGPASLQSYPMVNSQIAPLQGTPQDSQQNQDYSFACEEDQVSQGQEQDPQQLLELVPQHDPKLSQMQIPEKSFEQSPEQGREPIRRRARRRNIVMRGQPLLFILFLLTPGFALHVKTCSSPLGMESGEILDSALTASSSYVSNVGPQCARLNKEHLGGGWCPKGQVEATSREYVEVDFGGPRLITGLATQGRHGQGRGVEYLEGYTIEYFRPSLSSWHGYRRWDGNNVFSGNSDTVTVVKHSFTPPLHATNLRVYPHSLHLRTICLRMEVYGCEDDSGLLSYAAPAGSADLGDHVDREYDGVDGEDGLGRLTDGQIGGDFFLIDIGYARGSGWVGWRNSSFPSGYLEITFTFDAIRNISQVNLFANNYHSRNVQVFRTAVVYFSVGGKYFNGDPVVFSQHPDKNNESARNVSIPFNGGRLAKYTKIRLYFQSEWIMLGEVYFTSEITETNVTDEIHQKVFDDILELTLLNMDYDKSQYEPPSDLMIGSLAIVVLIVVALFLGMLVVHKRKAIGIFKRSNSYLGNDFSMKINMKDLFTNFTPGKDTAVDVLDSSPPSNYEARPPMIIRGELPGLAVGGPPCTLPLPPGNTLTRRKQSYVTATSPRRGKAVVTLAPPPVPPADLTFRTLYGQRPCSSKARDGPKYVDVSGGNMRGKAGGGAGWGGRNGSTDLLAISDLEDMHRRFLTPEQINNLTGAPAYVVWNIAPGLRNPRQEEDRDRVGGSDLPLSYLNLVSHSATGDLSSVDILQHSNFLCRRVSTIQNRGSRRHHSQELLELPYR